MKKENLLWNCEVVNGCKGNFLALTFCENKSLTKMLMLETSVTFIIFVEVFPRFSPCFFGPHLTLHDLLCFVASPISH